MDSKKRGYDKKIRKSLLEHKEFLVKHLESEWRRIDQMEKLSQPKTAATLEVQMTKIAIALVLAGGALTIMPTTPGVLSAFGRIHQQRIFFDNDSFKKAAGYLKRKKFVTLAKRESGYHLRITARGMERLLALAYKNLKIQKLTPWDRVWRVVFFDIPNQQGWAREHFRQKLKGMNFFPLQKSVFATPYPCADEIKFLSALLRVPYCIRIIETRTLENDFEVRKFFNLLAG